MTSEAQDDIARRAQEAAYRRGWQHGSVETTLLVLQLMELGYERRKIRQLLAIYNDLFVSAWRVGMTPRVRQSASRLSDEEATDGGNLQARRTPPLE